MAQIPNGTKFLGVDSSLADLTERNGTRVNSKTEFYTVEDIISNAGENLTLEQARQNDNLIEGDILFSDLVSNKGMFHIPSGIKNGLKFNGLSDFSLVYDDNNFIGKTALKMYTEQIVIYGSKPTHQGLRGDVDFSENYEDLTYVQKIYVDNPETLINVLNNANATQLETIKTILGII